MALIMCVTVNSVTCESVLFMCMNLRIIPHGFPDIGQHGYGRCITRQRIHNLRKLLRRIMRDIIGDSTLPAFIVMMWELYMIWELSEVIP